MRLSVLWFSDEFSKEELPAASFSLFISSSDGGGFRCIVWGKVVLEVCASNGEVPWYWWLRESPDMGEESE